MKSNTPVCPTAPTTMKSEAKNSNSTQSTPFMSSAGLWSESNMASEEATMARTHRGRSRIFPKKKAIVSRRKITAEVSFGFLSGAWIVLCVNGVLSENSLR